MAWSPRRCRLVQIRHATLHDLDDVITVREAALSRHAPDVYSDREVDDLVAELDETDLQQMISGGRLFVAERGGQIVGTAGWTNSHLRHVHVRPGDERAGIGTQLARRVEADFLRSGHSIEILVNATRNAEEFYAAIGYERCVEQSAPSTLFVVMKRRWFPAPIDPLKLGHGGYAYHTVDQSTCVQNSDTVWRSDDFTRPHEGVTGDQGFFISPIGQLGEGTTAPVYYDFMDQHFIAYWFFYAYDDLTNPYQDQHHEGDWHRRQHARLATVGHDPSDTSGGGTRPALHAVAQVKERGSPQSQRLGGYFVVVRGGGNLVVRPLAATWNKGTTCGIPRSRCSPRLTNRNPSTPRSRTASFVSPDTSIWLPWAALQTRAVM
jgi:GNAT superfamily N-acetyltransferase